ncbi:2-oxoglutarate dehydrogenase complex dihydrolipoyllysine-residue succinyltransferase [Brevibacillus humidisoli]|uniref:2-oxoglutarate dehydrogenase complex dihydrolipoyllysine-residue succinyltransferase n=1 Tax=Brevibacillus humidisoli TaxID=2895522 RepID=UPI001E2AD891|nr:2-oxoglutarate dehydrogenase complex dihydrolipoyllysine-residue succinyltransferase [Brevibacillus humidisoli]UFJ42018.1 2-oxoglutarate dehydrogenase complex dihydrolipoyllysine-residue succinyltransferase [Brevibacillus humidisoli]
MIEIKVPELAESITEGTISQWFISEGDRVSQGQLLVELETDKVNVEINAEHDGVAEKILSQAGDNVEVGQVIAILKESAESQQPEGADQSADQPAVSSAAVPADERETEEKPGRDEPGERDSRNRPTATPAARKLARQLGIDLGQVQTRDPLGRVAVEDIMAHSSAKTIPSPQDVPAGTETVRLEHAARPDNDRTHVEASEPAIAPDKPVERLRMSRRRQTIAKRLVEAQRTAAMLTTFNEVDMTAILDLRRRRQDAFTKQHGVRLGFMSFFTKAVIGALKAFPMLNAEIQGDEILLKRYYDIGIAVSTDKGLVVPVVRNGDSLSFAEIEREILTLAEKARDNTLSLSDLQDGTFSITNGGIFGSLLSTPILNTPQVGILGMHKIQTRPVAVDKDRMENRPMMYVALSYDHRIVDGKEAVSFLVKVKELLEDPENLLLEG